MLRMEITVSKDCLEGKQAVVTLTTGEKIYTPLGRISRDTEEEQRAAKEEMIQRFQSQNEKASYMVVVNVEDSDYFGLLFTQNNPILTKEVLAIEFEDGSKDSKIDWWE